MTGRAQHPGTKKDRPRGVQSRHPGVYARTEKSAGALVCNDCGAVQHGGRWRWRAPARAKVRTGRCPACRRIREGYPAGTLRIPRELFDDKDELLGIVRNVEEAERPEHPLERVMDVATVRGALVVTTTGVHVARKIAHRLARRFHRKARIRYADDESLIWVDWEESPEKKQRTAARGRPASR